MKTYTTEEIKELAKLGYIINSSGKMNEPTRLERIVNKQKQVDQETFAKKVIKSDSTYTEYTIGNKSGYTQKFHQNIDSEDKHLRFKQGLVLPKVENIEYSLLNDNTKVCRCCQERKEGKDFPKSSKTIDNLMSICRICNRRRGKMYQLAKKEKCQN